ncbi:adenosylcobinamide-GDP ribazoletransferase [Clostridium vincentii]|uniref:Adenosylcobinamide-GDP ribazoletransferase n=1 Tax=Clostridium vincentii TaxID=52704 RepID=A0A2T0BCJ9_9CLOT|nr:Cobalamin synthase [Clostridium vincentii]
MIWNSFKIAFSMYSKIPMPKTDWNKRNMKYALCFFPVVGLAILALVMLWNYISLNLKIGNILHTAILVVIPILVTGGIHLDGFLDTMDALSSYQPIEKKLEILKDPHTGAFAIISAITYFILYFGAWSEVHGDALIILSIGFILSRALSGLSIVIFPCAKNSGLVAMFSDAAEKDKVKYSMLFYIFICTLLMLFINIFLGGICVITALLVFIYYKVMSKKEFGGITGDLAGYFLQICELIMALSVVFIEKLFL